MSITLPERSGLHRGLLRRRSEKPETLLSLINQISRACATISTPADATLACLAAVVRSTGWAMGRAHERCGDGVAARMDECHHAPDMNVAAVQVLMNVREGLDRNIDLVERVVCDGRAVATADMTRSRTTQLAAAACQAGVKGWLAFPVTLDDRVQIVLEFFAREPAHLDEDLLEFMAFVSERLASTIAHARQVRVLDAALSNMAQGLLMLDDELRLIVCNEAYRELFGLTPELARAGVPLGELITVTGARSRRVHHDVDTLSERQASLALGKPFSAQFTVADGRMIEAAYNPMQGGWVATYSDVTARQAAEARLAHMARHDSLTDLPNRTFFHERLLEALGEAEDGPDGQSHRGSAVLCLDLDRFKLVNDTLGHALGDALLREVTGRIRRVVDGSVWLVARLGGDEFAVLMPRARPEQASGLAKALIDEVGRGYDIEGHRIDIGLSVGISISPGDGEDPGELLRAADMALYRAKAEGRGTFRLFEPEMDARMQARRELELDLRHALATEQFELHYQPLVALETDRITAFEALLRWHHPKRELVPPSQFISLAEDIGLIVPLGEWVLRQACREAATWPGDVRVAVNLSPVQFRSTALVLTVATALAAAGLDAKRLEVEVTEGVLLQHSETTLFVLRRLKEMGVRIAMDDFGTGYSSLSHLRAFAFDKIKIDRSFVAEIATCADALAIVRAVTSLGRSLGIETTAEGVETREQLDRLRAEGCTEVQGFLIGRPTAAHNLAAMLAYDEGPARAGAANRAC